MRKKAGTTNLRSLEFAIRESITGIIRNGLMSMASITTVAMSLGVLGAFVLFAMGLSNVVQTQLHKFEIAVWMDGSASQKDKIDVESEIRALPHVISVELVTAEATWTKIRHDWRDKVNLNGVQPGSLSDHFRVKLDDPRFTMDTAKALHKLPQVEEVIEGEQV